MIKNKDINFRLTDLDFEYLRKQAIKQNVSVSKILRSLVRQARERQK